MIESNTLTFLCADKMQEVAKSVTGVKKVISTWAKHESGAYWDCMDFDSMKQFDLRRVAPMGYFMSQGLLSAVRQKLGFDRCCAFYVSAAPIEVKILKYFASVDIPIMELFGQSECTGPHSINTYSAFKIGTVGRPLLGTETMLVEDTVDGISLLVTLACQIKRRKPLTRRAGFTLETLPLWTRITMNGFQGNLVS